MISASIVLTFTNLLTGMLGYIYQILMGRNLSPLEFGAFSAIMAAFMFASSPLGAVMMILSRRVTELSVLCEREKIFQLLKKSYIVFICAAIALFFAGYFFTDKLGIIFKVNDDYVIYAFFALLAANFFFVINNSFFQGLKHFNFLAVTALSSISMKILFSLILIYVGCGIFGAIAGGVVSLIFIVFSGIYLIYKRINSIPISSNNNNDGNWLSLNSIIPVLVANVAFAGMTQLDMVIVNHMFSTGSAGVYAAASVLGKAILYIPGGIVLALFPYVAEKHANNLSSNVILIQSLFAAFVCCGFAAMLYWFFSDYLIVFLYGDAYADASKLLAWYGLAIMPMALVLVVEHYLIAKKEVLFTWLFLIFAPVQVLLIYYFSTNLVSVIFIFGASGFALLILGLLLLLKRSYKTAE
ncbi:oligosaccharide flippase family protein [Marinospirillum perlucidum]|uniref:oligosaccharide flippase family protein n=1 Tax=Marinospirillum perlucidum TaxID=1982602 RepID=UPI001390268C|nr:oligosaccharide flippase family protein [Marinospirillum perlucidum]